MKAIVCTRYGSPEVLVQRDVEMPTPKEGEVLVKVRATTVTIGDARVRGFAIPLAFWPAGRIKLGLLKPRRPILGLELSGEVEALGENVRRFRKGDAVFGFPGHGSFGGYAEYACLPESRLANKPTNLGYEEAAAIPFGGLTALHFLRKANIKQGQHVLIYGASGSVGTFAVQIAKHLGARVTAVCGPTNVEWVRSLGADRVLDYTRDDYTQSGDGYDVVFDTVGRSSFSGCMRSLREAGVYLQALAVPFTLRDLRMRWASMTTRKRLVGGSYVATHDDLAFLGDLAATGKIKPVIDRRYCFEQMVEAHRYVDVGHKKGNVVVSVI